jgi:hypothetical protein
MPGLFASTRNRIVGAVSLLSLIIGLVQETSGTDATSVQVIGYRWNLFLMGALVGVFYGLAAEVRERGQRIRATEASMERNRAIRDQLAALRKQGDLVLGPMRSYYNRFFSGEASDSLVLSWSDEYLAWKQRVRTYLLTTPELGEAARHEFESLEDMPEPRMGHIHNHQRVEATMEAIRVHQRRLKEFMEDFKG